MRLTEKELILFRSNLLARRSYKGHRLDIWEGWMEDTLSKITDELYPQGMDRI